jgi:hypothetical protein
MSGTVNVAVVATIGFVLDMGRVDGYTTSFLLRCLINLGVVREFCSTFVGEDPGDSCSQGCFAMVDMT